MKRLLFVIMAVSIGSTQGFSQIREQYNFSSITTDDGLTHNMVEDIYKDSQGFMWFATWNGLDRYDGYEFIHYNTQSNSMSLKSIFVKSIAEDKYQRLWIASEGGVDVMDLKSSTPVIFEDNKSLSEILNTSSKSLFIDNKGTIWISSQKDLFYILTNGTGKPTKTGKLFNDKPAMNAVVCGDPATGKLYAAVSGRLYNLIYSNNSYTAIQMHGPQVDVTANISVLFPDNNSLWIGTNMGLFVYDLQQNRTRQYTHQPSDARSLSQNYITDIAKDKDENIIVTTLHGISIFDLHSNSFERITSTGTYRPNMLNSNFVQCLYPDNGVIWFGMDKGGINKMVKRRLSLQNYYHSDSDPHSLSPNPVNAIYEDSERTIWVGTVEGGLNKMVGNAGDTMFQHFVNHPNDPHSLSHNSVSTITQDGDKNLWIGTWGGGINKASNIKNSQLNFERFTQGDVPNMPSNYIASVVFDKANGGFWIGTPSGLSFLDPASRQLTNITINDTKQQMQSVGPMLLDNKKRLWIGANTGLICISTSESQPVKNKVKHIRFKELGQTPLFNKNVKINTIIQSADNTIWVGCMGNDGLFQIVEHSSATFKIKQYNDQHELSQNSIYGIIDDNIGNLWMSTSNGLLVFNPTDQSIRNFYKSDGLLDNQFYWNAYCGSDSGIFYFGSMDGLTCVNTNIIGVETQRRPPSITHIIVSGHQQLPETREGKQFLKIHEREKSLSIEFSALNYENPTKIKYSYRLVGFGQQWTEMDVNRRFANYTNLKRGRYTFEVKCTDIDGRWIAPVEQLEIRIVPFFYKTWWFILIMIVVTCFTAVRAYRYRVDSFHRKNELLRKVVYERTKEIHAQKVALEEKASQLSDTLSELIIHKEEFSRQNETLVDQNMKIMRQKEQILSMSKRVAELFVDKITFFTNITHELRTPVTLISGPIDKALSITDNPKVIEQLTFAKRNSTQLLSLINQIMDFRKIDTQNMAITKKRGNFIDYLNSLINSFQEYASERNITIDKIYKIEDPVFLFDEDNMLRILSNLLSNGIKFTPDNGKITVTVSTSMDHNSAKEHLVFSVRDSGNGIPEHEIERIFEEFYQSKQTQRFSFSGQSGTGIGLFLCKRLVELDNGTIKAMNNPDTGACFTVSVPIERGINDDIISEIDDIQAQEGDDTEEQDLLTDEDFDDKKQLILIVDDNKDMRDYIRSILIEQYNTITAENGKIALNMLSQYQPNIIISDIMMPKMNGVEFTKAAKSNFTSSHIPIVILTAKTSDKAQVECYDCGADAFICKPFNEEVMLARLRSILEQRTRMQAKFLYNMDADELGISDQSQDRLFMNRAIEIIKENYTDPEFDVAAFTNMMGMSRSLVYRKLQSLAGQPANKFIRIYRLNLAREIINKTKDDKRMNISEIAYQVGFNDPKYFTRCFTKHFGYPPSKEV